ncbi:glycosyltransferase involved in cell wall biosynthesis [Catenulispora sp. GP43]|uniref:glycosyltransferase family 2 protein n=1 Tax=Catenulispora sp. GP43 TaxID=3156263 RepID=UPI0035198CCD
MQSTSGNSTLIIIPAWNEGASIEAVVKDLRSSLPDVDVLVVDDGSTDDTAAVAGAAGAKVVQLPYNLGVGGARRLGYVYARNYGYQIAVQFDADGQHQSSSIPALIAGLEEADLVIGARFAGAGEYRASGPRWWAMSLFSFVISRQARTRLTDTTSGLRVCNRDLIEYFARWYPVEYLADTIDTLVRVIKAGYTVRQVPVVMQPRIGGVPSTSPLKSVPYLVRAVFVLLLAYIRE